MGYFDILKSELNKWNIDISERQIDQFNKYYDLLIYWNERINLTAITEPELVLYKHFIDSIALMKFCNLSSKSIIDVGTGAGFPGIPLAIMNPGCNVTLLDSLNKRINFLNEVVNSLELNNVTCYHGRAEDYGFDNSFREQFDIVTSRAVANLSTLSEYCIPFVKKGGYFIPYKSIQSEEEISNSKKALSILGGSIEKIEDYSIYIDDIVNRLIFIKKIKNTGKSYPRKAGTPSKQPL